MRLPHSPLNLARPGPAAALSLAAALAAGCAGNPMASQGPQYPVAGGSPGTVAAPVTLEYGRVTAIEYLPAGATAASGPNVMGAVVGGVAGAALGRQIGSGTGRDAATVLGGVAGAAAGSQVGRNQGGPSTTAPSYRVTVQTDQGVVRTYEVNATGDLRVGDRVRVENNVIYRS